MKTLKVLSCVAVAVASPLAFAALYYNFLPRNDGYAAATIASAAVLVFVAAFTAAWFSDKFSDKP